jgi:membrane-associated protein
MDPKKFHFFNIVGSFAWVSSMILSGYYLQKWILSQFGFDLKQHLEVIVLVIVFVTTAPVAWKMLSGPKQKPTS